MGFKNLSPPVTGAKVPPEGVAVSSSRRYKKKEFSPLVVNVSIGSELFEEWGSPDRVTAAIGEGADGGKLQLKAIHPDNKAPSFGVRVLNAGTATVRVYVPGVGSAMKGVVVEHDLDDDELTFILPAELFRASVSAHPVSEARVGRGGVTSSALH